MGDPPVDRRANCPEVPGGSHASSCQDSCYGICDRFSVANSLPSRATQGHWRHGCSICTLKGHLSSCLWGFTIFISRGWLSWNMPWVTCCQQSSILGHSIWPPCIPSVNPRAACTMAPRGSCSLSHQAGIHRMCDGFPVDNGLPSWATQSGMLGDPKSSDSNLGGPHFLPDSLAPSDTASRVGVHLLGNGQSYLPTSPCSVIQKAVAATCARHTSRRTPLHLESLAHWHGFISWVMDSHIRQLHHVLGDSKRTGSNLGPPHFSSDSPAPRFTASLAGLRLLGDGQSCLATSPCSVIQRAVAATWARHTSHRTP